MPEVETGQPSAEQSASRPQPEDPAAPVPQIDLRELAEKVYELLKQELRVERERLRGR
jgi:hypothetical protein